MKQYYRILCIWVVVALLLGALVPAAAAQEPQGAVEPQYVPPRPDLMEVLQQQDLLPGPPPARRPLRPLIASTWLRNWELGASKTAL